MSGLGWGVPKFFHFPPNQQPPPIIATTPIIDSTHHRHHTNVNLDNTNANSYIHCMENVLPTSAYDLLSQAERVCCDEYINYVANAFERYRDALSVPMNQDYVIKSKGVLMLPIVRAAVAQRIEWLANQQDLEASRVVKELEVLAFSNLADYIEPMEFGDFRLKNIDKIPKEKMAAVRKITSTPSQWGIKTEIVLHDKIIALNKLTELIDMRDGLPPPPPVNKGMVASEMQYMQMLEDMGGS